MLYPLSYERWCPDSLRHPVPSLCRAGQAHGTAVQALLIRCPLDTRFPLEASAVAGYVCPEAGAQVLRTGPVERLRVREIDDDEGRRLVRVCPPGQRAGRDQ